MNLIHPTFTTTSSYSASNQYLPVFDLCFGVKIRKSRHLFIVRSTKRTKSETPKHEVKRKLSHILRTEAAILGVERKAATTTSRTLWPRAVLEALENAVASDRWESALKVVSDFCSSVSSSLLRAFFSFKFYFSLGITPFTGVRNNNIMVNILEKCEIY